MLEVHDCWKYKKGEKEKILTVNEVYLDLDIKIIVIEEYKIGQ